MSLFVETGIESLKNRIKRQQNWLPDICALSHHFHDYRCLNFSLLHQFELICFKFEFWVEYHHEISITLVDNVSNVDCSFEGKTVTIQMLQNFLRKHTYFSES